MIAFVYILPIIACLQLHFEFDYNGPWYTYLWTIVFGEAMVGGLHWYFYDLHTSCTEFLGSMVQEINHEESWTELVEIKYTKNDKSGNSYTVTRIEERYHKEKYYFYTTRGSKLDTDYRFYSYVRGVWNVPRHTLSWDGRHIKGGVRYGSRYQRSDLDWEELENPDKWVPITESHSYTNKIRASNSIFKFEKIDKKQASEMGLLDYPAIYSYDAPCVLSNDILVSPFVDDLFRKFNARYAPEFEMRLYILLFDVNRGVGISEQQRAYWQGGNKNEFIICIGLNSSEEVEWARAFSWADEQFKEVETAQWLMHHPKLDWAAFHDWLSSHLMDWKRKEFKDFDYINLNLSLWQILTIIFLSIVENAFVIYLAVS
ncbi:MAG: hypothetical protein K2N48_04510 [Muribaculaceae bacterium]|nr:hypothetical protein [Muribaculaceae bacterium]